MHKKGEGEQFNWIFVLVAGSIILSFFVMFTFKYVELQEKKQDVEAIRFFGGKVLAASSKIDVGDSGALDSDAENGLRFGYSVLLGQLCTDNTSTVYVNKGDLAKYKLKDEVVFMPREMQINALDIWILPWKYPFQVTNFIYLADPKTRFYLVKDAASRDFVDALEINSIFNVTKVTKDQLRLTSKSKVIYFTSEPPSPVDLKLLKGTFTDVSFVSINLRKKPMEASFFDFQTSSWSSGTKFYVTEEDKAQLYGAIFSTTKLNFECTINRAITKVKLLSSFYSERANLLGQIDTKEGCHYAEMSKTLLAYTKDLSLVDAVKQQNLAGAGCLWVF